jgi:hypothetical protein
LRIANNFPEIRRDPGRRAGIPETKGSEHIFSDFFLAKNGSKEPTIPDEGKNSHIQRMSAYYR